MRRAALRREADAAGIVWCRWCGGEISQHPDEYGRHVDATPCETDDMTNNEGEADDCRD